MSRRSSYRSGVSRGTMQLFWAAALLVVVAVLAYSGLWAGFFAWIGDVIVDQVTEIGNTQPE